MQEKPAAVGVIGRAGKLHFARTQHVQWHAFHLPPITGPSPFLGCIGSH